MKYQKWGLVALLLIVTSSCTVRPYPPAAPTEVPTIAPPGGSEPPGALTIAPTLAQPSAMIPATSTPAPTSTVAPQPPSTSTVTAGSPIDPSAPEVVNTPLPGEGSLNPLGQHAYSVTLELTGAKGLTRTVRIDYLLYLPGDYRQDSQQPWPLILFMHGSDQRGTDADMVAADGLPKMLTATLYFPAMVLSPQVPEDETWNTQLPETTALLDYIQAHYAADPKRLYLTGISMGSFGAWDLALRHPRRFAALVPIAGGWDSERDVVPRNICDIKDMPIWVFHGQQDDIVPPRKSEMMVNALRRCGSTVQFTLYPDANHRESWARAYADPNLYEWLLQQSLP